MADDPAIAHLLDRLDLEPEFVDQLRLDLEGDIDDTVAAAVRPQVSTPA